MSNINFVCPSSALNESFVRDNILSAIKSVFSLGNNEMTIESFKKELKLKQNLIFSVDVNGVIHYHMMREEDFVNLSLKNGVWGNINKWYSGQAQFRTPCKIIISSTEIKRAL